MTEWNRRAQLPPADPKPFTQIGDFCTKNLIRGELVHFELDRTGVLVSNKMRFNPHSAPLMLKPVGLDMNASVEAGWEKFLNPDSLKHHLLAGGIYLAAYEMFKTSLVGRPRDMFWTGFRHGEEIIDPKYQKEVLALDPKRIYHASALWWQKRGVLTEADVAKASAIRKHRDEIAHDIPRFLGTAEGVIRLDLLEATFELVAKIDQWWIREVEIPTDPAFDDRTLTQEELSGVMSGNMVFLSLMIPIAFGDDSRLRTLYEQWKDELAKRKRT